MRLHFEGAKKRAEAKRVRNGGASSRRSRAEGEGTALLRSGEAHNAPLTVSKYNARACEVAEIFYT